MAQVDSRVLGFQPAAEHRQLGLAQGFGLAHRLLFASLAVKLDHQWCGTDIGDRPQRR